MKYFEIGAIVNTLGINGEIKVIPLTEDPKRFELLNEIEIFNKNKSKVYKIIYVRYHKQFIILKLEGIDSINKAELLKNCVIKITEDKALPLRKDEYYARDLYGLKVITDKNQVLGTITDIISAGSANDVYVVKNTNSKEILIPAIKQCILDVNLTDNIMVVKLLKGLI